PRDAVEIERLRQILPPQRAHRIRRRTHAGRAGAEVAIDRVGHKQDYTWLGRLARASVQARSGETPKPPPNDHFFPSARCCRKNSRSSSAHSSASTPSSTST